MASQTGSPKPVGPRLVALMDDRDMRPEDLAAQLVVSHSTVLRWMRGSNEPTPGMARRLGALFGVDWRGFYEEAA